MSNTEVIKLNKEMPEVSGTYLCYLKMPNNIVARSFLNFKLGIWKYADVNAAYKNTEDILGWIGPIPEAKLDTLPYVETA